MACLAEEFFGHRDRSTNKKAEVSLNNERAVDELMKFKVETVDWEDNPYWTTYFHYDEDYEKNVLILYNLSQKALDRFLHFLKDEEAKEKRGRLLDEVSFERGDTEYIIKYYLQKDKKAILKEVWYQEWEGEFSPQKVGEETLDYREVIKL